MSLCECVCVLQQMSGDTPALSILLSLSDVATPQYRNGQRGGPAEFIRDGVNHAAASTKWLPTANFLCREHYSGPSLRPK